MKTIRFMAVYLALSVAAHSQTNSMVARYTNLPVEARALLSREQPKGDGHSITGLVVCSETKIVSINYGGGTNHALVTNIPYKWLGADESKTFPTEGKEIWHERWDLAISIGDNQFEGLWYCCADWESGMHKKQTAIVFHGGEDPYLRIRLHESNIGELTGVSTRARVTLTKIRAH